jgi:hypothetical protein
MREDKLTEILINTGVYTHLIPDARSAILTWIKEEVVPKERSMVDDKLKCYCDGEGYCNCEFSENDGYNQAISEINAKLGELND